MKKNIGYLSVLITFLLVVSCSKPEDISGHLDGIWTTQWEDLLKGDVDDIKVEEAIEFVSENFAGNRGEFHQIFEGEVKFDDWENESWVPYSVFISGSWNVKKNNIIELRYDLNEMVVDVGKSNVEADYTDAGISLLFGDWSGALSSALKASDTSKINQKIEKEITNQLNSFFKEMFHDINKDKKGMTDVVIDGDMMTCEVNHGFFGREQTYDRIKTSKVGEKNNYVSDEDDEIIGEVYAMGSDDSEEHVMETIEEDPDFGTSKGSYKVIADINGNIIGDYVGETSSEYIGMGQDEFRVSKSNHKVIEINRENEGIVFCKEPGDIVNIYAQPSVNSHVIGKMIYEPGELPETYECIGKNGNWYKIRFNHKNGYVNVELVEWAAEDYF